MVEIRKILKQNIVTVIAFLLAAISCFFVLPNKEYLSYFNWDTLMTLFMTMLLVAGFKAIRIFEIVSSFLVSKFKTIRSIGFVLIGITFVGSMVLANDMALLTFIPLTLTCVKMTKKDKYAAFIITMQVISANLGGMLTPFGNPQNMYIYSYFNVDPLEFMSIMLPSFLVALALIIGTMFFLKREPTEEIESSQEEVDKVRTILYSILFIFAIIVIFRVVPMWLGFIIICPIVIISNYKTIFKVDYGLLLTFVFFFIFAGNVARIENVKSFIESVFVGRELVVGTLSCQFISNVPSAILLSQFTTSYNKLLVAVNIGGLGTLIASLASLIAFKQYVNTYHSYKKYLLTFELINFSFLAILLIFNLILL